MATSVKVLRAGLGNFHALVLTNCWCHQTLIAAALWDFYLVFLDDSTYVSEYKFSS